jgi:xanthine dehydrogenase accessory factor
MQKIYQKLLDYLKEGKPLALATIVSTKGSSPQVPGVSALFIESALLSGTLGGGVLEARAQDKAIDSIKNRTSCLSNFGLYADISSKEEAICGGEADILFDIAPADNEEVFRLLLESLKKGRSGVLVTSITRITDNQVIISRSWIEKDRIFGEKAGNQVLPFKEEIKQSFASGKPLFLSARREKEAESLRPEPGQEQYIYLEPIQPLSHLIIAGAGHVGQALAHLGTLLDFEVTVIDDRPEFANRLRFPEVEHIIVEDIEKAIRDTPKTADSYFVIVTRGHSQDAEALRACIGSDAAYIGMIGSARKIALMRKDFLDRGWATPSQLDRVHAPIGIDIQSKTVQEIAVSIAAELILIRSKLQNKSERSL